ncbi:DinB family protein [Streptomyces sp. XM4193]|uniref:DinB family protein n=1 Tax=Streptomyces sp. XM4193 TaxID=2929782 RepID=UPI001FF95F6B|nr:DinB family protein [Streptomyces sp. XM4193]MCK1796901.1 DinB family protein [Streptomyces sp. XM4193]
MTEARQKADLRRYLQAGREALLWKLDGLSEYEMRRPMTPTGTNLLGLVKHMAGVEIGYFGETFGRPFDPLPAWLVDLENAEENVDMWATAEEPSADIVGLYHRVWEHADATIESLPLDAPGEVPHWPQDRRHVTLHQIVVHVIADLTRHAGHADILRELIDGAVGMREGNDNMPSADRAWWERHHRQVERAASEFAPS